MLTSVGIIGGGIVGSTAAFYLSQENYQVTLFDEGIGQASSAAAGIISPWLSQRRNKRWYFLAKEGAKFYTTLLDDLQCFGEPTPFYQKTGTILYKKNKKLLDKLHHVAQERKKDAPEIGDILYLTSDELKQKLPLIESPQDGLFISGGAKVDGKQLIQSLNNALIKRNGTLIREKVDSIAYKNKQWLVTRDQQTTYYDMIILACGAWLPNLLEPLQFNVDIRPQKGQLLELSLNEDTHDWPVVMPVGESDIIPFDNGKFVVGATHENDQGFDLTIDPQLLSDLQNHASLLMPCLKHQTITHSRAGIRAYTSDFLPFFGQISTLPNLYVASGLGSSGLTTGPIIGKTLADWIQNEATAFDSYKNSPNDYISSIV